MIRTTAFALLLVSATAATAHADDAATKLATTLDPFISKTHGLRYEPSIYDGNPMPAAKDCDAAVAAARKAGLGDDAKIYAYGFRGWDEAHYDDKNDAYLTLADVDAMCRQYPSLLLMVPAAAAQKQALEWIAGFGGQDPSQLGAGTDQNLIKEGEACLAATDKAIKAGAPADLAVKIGGATRTLTEGREQACQALIDLGRSFTGKAGQADADKLAAIRKRYVDAGIKGARLELFIEQDNIYWMVKGCVIEFDLRKLKKAKKLFQWWEGPSGEHTIRTFTFAGDKVKSIKDKTYEKRSQAAKGCK